MVFLGTRFFEREHPELLRAARRQAAAFGWDGLVSVCDDPAEAVDFIAGHDPDGDGSDGVERRRAHRPG
jgi:hypothetical protein